ncbi:hypothetical protein M422DRAFT_274015 [Sphaerobolus stellatus SS14]|uniref:Uncharacterized protein n=1 Tax=Sphaerobolus stellatus (strain SS14) TaxID=990650 RepID=A0A0C9U7J8_SPHS4|nr:hypothetical protein M422DRAFT_274015 [Sphaerobolus stellatus SS14]
MILTLPLQSSTIDPNIDLVLLIGGLKNLLQIAKVQDSDNLLPRIALNQSISHLHHPEANTIVIAWLESFDLTVTPPKLLSLPLDYVCTQHKSAHFFHGSSVLRKYRSKPDTIDPDCILHMKLIYKNGRFFIIHLITLPPLGSSSFVSGELYFD